MVHLAPVPFRILPKDTSSANGKSHRSSADDEFTPLTTDYVEQITTLVQTVIIKFKLVCALAFEESFVCRSDLAPAALDSTQGIVHGSLSGVGPILLHQLEVAGI